MRLLQIVILTLITVYPDDVLSKKGSKVKQSKKQDLGPCGRRYLRQVNGKCYYFAGKKMSWFGAQNNCLRKSLNLADLANEEDFNAIIKFLRTRGNMEDYWFGGNDLQTEGRFTYISTGRPVRYFGGLESIEPTHRANLDDCLEVRLRSNGTTVTDDNCEEKQYFVCQVNELKCAQPVAESAGNEHHSHEHLHHFHHDAGKNENGNASQTESLESDSRPLDNSRTAEDFSPENPKETSKAPGGETPETTHETSGTATPVQQTTTSVGNVETTVNTQQPPHTPQPPDASQPPVPTGPPTGTPPTTIATPPPTNPQSTDAPPAHAPPANAPPADAPPANAPPADTPPANAPPADAPPTDDAPAHAPPADAPPADTPPANAPPADAPPADTPPANAPPADAPAPDPPQEPNDGPPLNPNGRAPKEAPMMRLTGAPIGISTATVFPQGPDRQITPNTNEFV